MTAETYRNNETGILCALAEHGQAATAAVAGISETRLSRWKSDGGLSLEEVARVLAALGIELVQTGGDAVTVPREKYQALLVLTREFADAELRGPE